mmetsp:Transcript_16095/g.15492  ORF Transcript_16095/g.15492 Transcript_16095/m.15492 type:complete len:236 (-) Transcript_16095:912-1619(-)
MDLRESFFLGLNLLFLLFLLFFLQVYHTYVLLLLFFLLHHFVLFLILEKLLGEDLDFSLPLHANVLKDASLELLHLVVLEGIYYSLERGVVSSNSVVYLQLLLLLDFPHSVGVPLPPFPRLPIFVVEDQEAVIRNVIIFHVPVSLQIVRPFYLQPHGVYLFLILLSLDLVVLVFWCLVLQWFLFLFSIAVYFLFLLFILMVLIFLLGTVFDFLKDLSFEFSQLHRGGYLKRYGIL